MPAGRSRLYVGSYAARPDQEPPTYNVIPTGELTPLLPAGAIVCGEAALAVTDAASSAGARVADAHPPTRSAATLAALAHARLIAGQADDTASLQPLYLRSAQVDMARRTWGTRA